MSWRDKIAKTIAEGIRAYHGSPHSFDKFDVSKLGTGEGAQTYGRGLYFAGNEDVARYYRDTLAPSRGKLPDDVIAMSMDPRRAFMTHAGKLDVDPLTAAKRAQYMSPPLRQEDVNKLAGLIEQTRAARKGHMYEVNINAAPEQLLDWDAPLRQQPAGIQQIAKENPRIGGNDVVRGQLSEPTGQNVWHRLHSMKGEAAPKVLQHYGVPGIRYLDQESRAAAEAVNDAERVVQHWQARRAADPSADNLWWAQGAEEKLAKAKQVPTTSNYVVFDDSLIDIMRKYGVAGAAPIGMGALAAQDQYSGAQQ